MDYARQQRDPTKHAIGIAFVVVMHLLLIWALLSGLGLFLTYLGFNLLYSRFGASQYVLYAVLSIITTTIVVGIWWLKEPVNLYQKVAIVLAIAAVVLFSVGQTKA